MFRGRPLYSNHWRHRMAERFEQMDPEQRERLRQALGSRCRTDPKDSTPAGQ